MMIEPAYTALAARLAQRLVACGFLSSLDALKVDPESAFEPDGEETEVTTSAALVKVKTAPVRQTLGRPTGPRYVVERECGLDLSIAGPAQDLKALLELAVMTAVATTPGDDPTLGGLCERLELTGRNDNEIEPNGLAVFLTFTLRVRSGDPLGMTP